MKNLYIIALCLLAAFGFAQSVVITRVVAGTLPADGCTGIDGNSSPKFVELYVSGTLDLTNYRLQTEFNGVIPLSPYHWNAGTNLTSIGTVTDSFVYILGIETMTFAEMYPSIIFPTNLGIGLPYGDGNDCYRIARINPNNGVVLSVIDQFGTPTDHINEFDFSATWAYRNSYAKRNNGVPPNGGIFDSSTFTYGGNDALTAPNNTCEYLISALGIGEFTLGMKDNLISGLNVYPNPVSDGNLYITSDRSETKSVVIYDVFGKQVVKANVNNQVVNVSNLTAGVYIVKITEAGKTAIRKLIIE